MVGTMHTDYAPRARPQTAPAACFPPPHCLCLHAPRVLACGASCVRCELAPTGNTHLYSTVSKCMLDRTPEEPGPLAAAACSRRSRLPTHRMMRTWAARSLRVLHCAVASSSPPCNRMGNVGTAGSLQVEPRPLFSSACNLCSSSPMARIPRSDSSSLSCVPLPATSVRHRA